MAQQLYYAIGHLSLIRVYNRFWKDLNMVLADLAASSSHIYIMPKMEDKEGAPYTAF